MNSIFIAELIKNPDMMNMVFESLPEPTFLIDKSGTYMEAWGGNDKTRHHDPTTLVGLNQYQVFSADKAIWFSQVIVDVIESQTAAELEYSLEPKSLSCFDGVEGPEQLQYFSALIIPLPGTSFVLWTVRNITEYKRTLNKLAQQQQKLEQLTYTDHLTQMYNRYALESLLPNEIEIAKLKLIGSAVLMIDVDCFKQYNDHFGHLKGDQALVSLSRAIRAWEKSEDFCFRYGGDEFLIFMPNVTEAESLQRAELLQEVVAGLNIPHPASVVGNKFSITVGVKHYPIIPQDLDAEKFISVADEALFYAKGLQRGTIHQLVEHKKELR